MRTYVSGAESDRISARSAPAHSAFTISIAFICIYAIFALAVIPFAGIPGPEIPVLPRFFAATVFATELSTSFLLFVHFRANPHWSLLILGSAFLYSALMIVPHLLTFPGAVLTDRPLVGGSRQAPGYIYVSWVTAEVKAKLDAQGLVPAGLCGTDFATYLRSQVDDYARIIREAHIKAQ